jgi:hypothetical protein
MKIIENQIFDNLLSFWWKRATNNNFLPGKIGETRNTNLNQERDIRYVFWLTR